MLIFITAITFIVGVVDTYNYEMANDDMWVGFGAVLTAIVGGFVIFYELDLFFTVYFFFLKPKSVTKFILNILSNLTLLLIFFGDDIADFLYRHLNIFKEDGLLPLALFIIYLILRFVCIAIPISQTSKEK